MMPMHLCQSLCTKKVDQNSHGLVSLVQTYDSHALVQTYDSHAHQRVTNVLFSLMLLVNVSINFIIFILVALYVTVDQNACHFQDYVYEYETA